MAPLDHAEIQQRLAGRDSWRLSEGRSPDAIEREWTLADFAAAVAFVNRVAEVSERANHHPDVLLHGWNKVRLTLSTHSQGGLTDADFELADQIDLLV
jgi:4a-hydroxytetrahydrobiopterin dehydratase